MSGSMSREWKRTVWQAPQARRTTPRHFLTLPAVMGEAWDEAAIPISERQQQCSPEAVIAISTNIWLMMWLC